MQCGELLQRPYSVTDFFRYVFVLIIHYNQLLGGCTHQGP